MSNAFSKEVRRSITHSLGRFIALAAIVALGTGFYAGLLMTPKDMNQAADTYFDETKLMDIQVIAPLGLSDDDLAALRDIDGVEAVMPAYQSDAIVDMAGETYATRIHSLSPSAADSNTSSGVGSVSDDPDCLNRLILVDGSWPTKEGECVLSADLVSTKAVKLGDTVTIQVDSAEEAEEETKEAAEDKAKKAADQATGEATAANSGAGTEPSSTTDSDSDTDANSAAGADSNAANTTGSDAVTNAASDADADSTVASDATDNDFLADLDTDFDTEFETPELEFDNAIDDILATTEYKVVGFVSSPSYAVASPMGSTSMGSGSIQQFMYVPESDFSDDLPYTEAYITVEGARDLDASEGAYERRVAEVTAAIKAIAPKRAEIRADDLRGDYQQTLDDAREQYDDLKTKVNTKFEDVEQQLVDAETEISDNEETITEAQEDYESGLDELETRRSDAQDQFDEAKAQFDEARSQLEEVRATLTKTSDELDAAWAEYNAGATALNEAWQQWKTQAETASQARADAQNVVGQLQANIDALNTNIAQCEEALSQEISNRDEVEIQKSGFEAQLAANQEQLVAAQEAFNTASAAETQVLAARDQLEERQSQTEAAKAELDARQEEFYAAVAAYEAQVSELNAGVEELEAQRDTAEEEINDAQTQLEDARTEIESGSDDISTAKEDVSSGRTEYEKSKAEAMEKLNDAERKLAEAQQSLDDLEAPEWFVLDRESNYGSASYQADADRIASIAAVFPLIFFLVAALVALTTMTRMVDEERQYIGTLKALGYSKGRIASKYLFYAFAASGLGALIGIFLLSEALPYIIMTSYGVIYYIPLEFPLPLDAKVAAFAAVLGIGITLLATAVAVWAELREKPASLMLPPAPKAGKRILLERTPLWKPLSFTWKITLRNLMRYKRRFVMTVVGIAGCTALLLTGLGLSDSINDILIKQYDEITKYNTTVVLDDDIIANDRKAVNDVLQNQDLVKGSTRVMSEHVLGSGPAANEERLELIVPSDPTVFDQFFTMRTRLGHELVELPSDGFVLTEKVALLLGVEVGDSVTLTMQDEIGNATDESYSVQVTGIVENYLYHYGFMGTELYKQTFGEDPSLNSLYIKATDDPAGRDQLTTELRDIPGVKTVLFNDETIATYQDMLSTVDKVVAVLILAAALLAFIVLYNLTNINISERIREIATLRVLGFTKGETGSYIFREIILLSIIGGLLGLALGVWMEGFVVTTAEVDQSMFGREIHPLSFVLAFLLTQLFTAIVCLFMKRKISRVNMVESLKSNE